MTIVFTYGCSYFVCAHVCASELILLINKLPSKVSLMTLMKLPQKN